jgi:hypothetical protein
MVANHRDKSHRREWSAIETQIMCRVCCCKEENSKINRQKRALVPTRTRSLDQIQDNLQEPITLNVRWTLIYVHPCYRTKTLQHVLPILSCIARYTSSTA